ncbi:MAG: DNA polymerase III subunit gamma/tau [bacterium]
MGYISLYRKYRSQNFEEIVGQGHITTTLKNTISAGRIAHAYLFSGPRGTGKTSTARIFAKALNCENGPTPAPCNQCANCIAIAKDTLFDVVEIDAASNRGIDDIRDLREKVRVPPVQGRYKVYIIDESHMLTREAFNALLKTLEEPPPHVIFILATTERHKLPQTILSRCQGFEFRRIPPTVIREHLEKIAKKEKFKVDNDAMDTIVATADGSLRDAISVLDQLVSYSGGDVTLRHVHDVLGMIESNEIVEFVDALLSAGAGRCFELLEQFFNEGKSAARFLQLLLEHLRDIYFMHAGIKQETAVRGETKDKSSIERQAGKMSASLVAKMMDEIGRVEDRIRWETYPRIAVEVMIIKLLDMAGAGCGERHYDSGAEETEGAEEIVRGSGARRATVAEDKRRYKPAEALPELEGELTIEKVKLHWNAFIQEMKKKYLPTSFILLTSTPYELENDTFVVAYDSTQQFNKEQLQEQGNTQKVEEMLEKYFGRRLRLKARIVKTLTVEGRAPAAQPLARTKESTSLLDMLQEAFPGSEEI